MKFRTDIQALRGLAVLLVILQHAQAGFIDAGFLGVDIFFVISGFLITGMLADQIGEGRFRFAEFYFRRARRLLPAAYATFLATAVLGFFLLDAIEWNDFTWQLAGAVTFTGNIALWQQTGYFASEAALKPLLHVWSLAVEEQYYLLLPLALWLAPRRAWLAGSLVVLIASFALCAWWSLVAPEAAFYLLPTRAWELAIGSLAALWLRRDPRVADRVAPLFLPALLAVLVVPVLPLPAPAFANIAIVCVATALLILRRHPLFEQSPLSHGLARVGDASYSLYLAHWPVFAFLHNAYAGDPSFGEPGPVVLVAATALALLLGWALYRYVEMPMRRAPLAFRRRWVFAALASSALLALVPLGLSARTTTGTKSSGVDYAWLRRDNVGFSDACETYDLFVPSRACSESTAPETMVWGDSFAMHLVPGIAATSDVPVVQATKSACGPLPGLAQIHGVYTRAFAERCLAFNYSVLNYLAETPSIRTVALSSSFYPYFDPARRVLYMDDGTMVERMPDAGLALVALRDTVSRLRSMGKRVVVVAPPPSTGFDHARCLERKARNRTPFARFIDCSLDRDDYIASKHETLAFLERLQREANVDVVSFDALLCDAQRCRTELDGSFVYRDEGHLSYDGSVAVARAMDLAPLLERSAR